MRMKPTASAGWSKLIRRIGKSTPVKHTSLGRFKHEGANVRIAKNGKAVAYSGDDSRFEYLYKFVSKNTYSKHDRKQNMTLLSEGDLYVAEVHRQLAGKRIRWQRRGPIRWGF